MSVGRLAAGCLMQADLVPELAGGRACCLSPPEGGPAAWVPWVGPLNWIHRVGSMVLKSKVVGLGPEFTEAGLVSLTAVLGPKLGSLQGQPGAGVGLELDSKGAVQEPVHGGWSRTMSNEAGLDPGSSGAWG